AKGHASLEENRKPVGGIFCPKPCAYETLTFHAPETKHSILRLFTRIKNMPGMRNTSIDNSIETKQQHHLSLPNKSKNLIQNSKDMTHQINTSEARVYVGTYAKYNDGSIFGEWLKLSDYANKEEFYTACRELHDDEEDPEFMFQDYENIPNGLIGECWISDSIFEILRSEEHTS